MPDEEDKGEIARPLTPETLTLIEGFARQPGGAPCPACGRAVQPGQEVVTTLGDLQLGLVGVTLHQRCLRAVGRVGLFELMQSAYQQRTGPET